MDSTFATPSSKPNKSKHSRLNSHGKSISTSDLPESPKSLVHKRRMPSINLRVVQPLFFDAIGELMGHLGVKLESVTDQRTALTVVAPVTLLNCHTCSYYDSHICDRLRHMASFRCYDRGNSFPHFLWLLGHASSSVLNSPIPSTVLNGNEQSEADKLGDIALVNEIKQYITLNVLQPFGVGTGASKMSRNISALARQELQQKSLCWLVALLDQLIAIALCLDKETESLSTETSLPACPGLSLLRWCEDAFVLQQHNRDAILVQLLQKLSAVPGSSAASDFTAPDLLSSTVCCVAMMLRLESIVRLRISKGERVGLVSASKNDSGSTVLVPNNISQLIRLCLSKAVYPSASNYGNSLPSASQSASNASLCKENKGNSEGVQTAVEAASSVSAAVSDLEANRCRLGLRHLLAHPLLSENPSNAVAEVVRKECVTTFVRKWYRRMVEFSSAKQSKAMDGCGKPIGGNGLLRAVRILGDMLEAPGLAPLILNELLSCDGNCSGSKTTCERSGGASKLSYFGVFAQGIFSDIGTEDPLHQLEGTRFCHLLLLEYLHSSNAERVPDFLLSWSSVASENMVSLVRSVFFCGDGSSFEKVDISVQSQLSLEVALMEQLPFFHSCLFVLCGDSNVPVAISPTAHRGIAQCISAIGHVLNNILEQLPETGAGALNNEASFSETTAGNKVNIGLASMCVSIIALLTSVEDQLRKTELSESSVMDSLIDPFFLPWASLMQAWSDQPGLHLITQPLQNVLLRSEIYSNFSAQVFSSTKTTSDGKENCNVRIDGMISASLRYSFVRRSGLSYLRSLYDSIRTFPSNFKPTPEYSTQNSSLPETCFGGDDGATPAFGDDAVGFHNRNKTYRRSSVGLVAPSSSAPADESLVLFNDGVNTGDNERGGQVSCIESVSSISLSLSSTSISLIRASTLSPRVENPVAEAAADKDMQMSRNDRGMTDNTGMIDAMVQRAAAGSASASAGCGDSCSDLEVANTTLERELCMGVDDVKVAFLERENENLRKKLLEKDSSISNSERYVDDLKGKVTSLEVLLNEAYKKLQVFSQTESSRASENRANVANLREMEEKLLVSQKESLHYRLECEGLRLSFENSKSAINRFVLQRKDLEEQNSRLIAELQAAHQRNSQCENELNKKKEVIEEYRWSAESKQRDIDQLMEEVADERSTVLALRNELADKDGHVVELQQKFAESTASCESLNMRLRERENFLQEVSADLKLKISQNKQLEEEAHNMKLEIENGCAQLNSVQEKYADLAAMLQVRDDELLAGRTEIEKLKMALKTIESEKLELEGQLVETMADLKKHQDLIQLINKISNKDKERLSLGHSNL